MSIELLSAQQYRALQLVGEFELRTSCSLQAPPSIRTLSGTLFRDRPYATVFVHHNGADSYQASRGLTVTICV